MARSIYIASPNAGTGKSTVALGLVSCLTKVVAKVGVFRPFVESREGDAFLSLLLNRAGSTTPAEQCVGATWDEFHADPEEALARIVDAYRAMAREHDVVIIDGSDFTDVAGNPELALNARVAANIGVPVLLVVSGQHDVEDVVASVEVSMAEIADNHARTVAVVANKCLPETRQAVGEALTAIEGITSTTLPEVPLLAAPVVREVLDAVEGTLIAGDETLLDREAESVLVCAMDVAHVLERLTAGQLAIVPADRSAMLISLMAAQASSSFPILSGLILNGGFEVAPHALRLLEGLDVNIPVITSPLDTFAAASAAGSLQGLLAHGSERKIDVAVTTFEQEADVDALLSALEVEPSEVVTPIMFQAELVERSRTNRKTIVLPEPDDDRVLRAAHTTAHTIVPSFQIIKTKPGTSIVSSVFLMLLQDRVLVYGDCAVNPEPNAAELADIAISSAATARQFGVEPRVAMLSFSTGTSGKGADVDKVREAAELVRAKEPDLAVEGPIQYDAAIDPTVAAKKAPDSLVAGRANVFIFPDLSSGNIGYKAVQRSSGAIAIGPVLQGLNKPVNDLSRGALVEDIINTVAITAVQAQG